ncbi:MAG: protein phosphatase 2C domain-containing protein [Gemmatimonadales bacterium]|jgi:protein phosphatase|nr:protein phosphatase 2C domain-containing protein [Gemmatimonadales bacterium]
MTGSVQLDVFARTDLGRTRDHNEDTFLVADLSRARAGLEPGVRAHEVGRRGSLLMVADGMGGAAAGEVASSMAAEHIFAHLVDHDEDGGLDIEQFARRLSEAVDRANSLIHAYALEHPDVRGMGTTVTAAGIHEGQLVLAQVGDSRAYLVRGGRAFQLTKDQSLTQRLVDAGELTEEEAELSARRNIILQALGPDPRVKVVVSLDVLHRDDLIVLCSDGLSNVVRREEIAQLASRLDDLSALCDALIGVANERGGPDNITVVAARVSGSGLTPASEGEEPNPVVMRLGAPPSASDDFIPGLAPVVKPAPTPPPIPAPPAPGVPAQPAEAPRSLTGWILAAVLLGVALTWLFTR